MKVEWVDPEYYSMGNRAAVEQPTTFCCYIAQGCVMLQILISDVPHRYYRLAEVELVDGDFYIKRDLMGISLARARGFTANMLDGIGAFVWSAVNGSAFITYTVSRISVHDPAGGSAMCSATDDARRSLAVALQKYIQYMTDLRPYDKSCDDLKNRL